MRIIQEWSPAHLSSHIILSSLHALTLSSNHPCTYTFPQFSSTFLLIIHCTPQVCLYMKTPLNLFLQQFSPSVQLHLSRVFFKLLHMN